MIEKQGTSILKLLYNCCASLCSESCPLSSGDHLAFLLMKGDGNFFWYVLSGLIRHRLDCILGLHLMLIFLRLRCSLALLYNLHHTFFFIYFLTLQMIVQGGYFLYLVMLNIFYQWLDSPCSWALGKLGNLSPILSPKLQSIPLQEALWYFLSNTIWPFPGHEISSII